MTAVVAPKPATLPLYASWCAVCNWISPAAPTPAALLEDHDGHAERAAEFREAAATIEASLEMLVGA